MKKGSLSLDKANKLLTEIFPSFSSSIFEAFLDEEISKNDIRNGVDYKTFLNIVKKWYKQCQSASLDTEGHLISEPSRSRNPIFGDDEDDDLMKLGTNFLKQNNKLNNETKKTSSMGELPPLNSNQNKKPLTIKDLGKDDDYDDDFTK